MKLIQGKFLKKFCEYVMKLYNIMLTFRSSPLNVNLQGGEGRVGRDGFCCGGMDNPLSLSVRPPGAIFLPFAR